MLQPAFSCRLVSTVHGACPKARMTLQSACKALAEDDEEYVVSSFHGALAPTFQHCSLTP